VAKKYAVTGRFSVGVAEPGGDFFCPLRGFAGVGLGALAFQVQHTVLVTKAHAGEVVGDNPQTLHVAQILRPHSGFIAVHFPEKIHTVGAFQDLLYLFCIGLGLFCCPLGRDARVYQGVAMLLMN